MLGNQEYTFFIKFRVCGSPLWTTYKVFQFLPGSGWYSYNVGTEDKARDMVSRLSTLVQKTTTLVNAVSYLFNKSKSIDNA